jgi:hypothetical protein
LKKPLGSSSPHACVTLTQRQFGTGAAGGSAITKETHCWPAGHVPPQVGYCDALQAFGETVVVVVDVVVVVEVAHPPIPQASQQLAKTPTHPPRCVHRPALPRTLHRVPLDPTRQHVTAPGRPHVDRRAQRITVLAHPRERS